MDASVFPLRKDPILFQMKYSFFLISMVLFASGKLTAQHYTAINGSAYFGSLGVYNNPSTIVNTPFKWDITLFGAQFTTISNVLRGHNFPLYATPSAKFSVANGNYARMADLNYNIKLLNARYSLNKNQAFAFGFNVRGYTQAVTSPVNYTDSVKGSLSFLSYNEQNKILHIQLASSTWMEVYGSYAFTLWDKETSRFTGGATLKVMKGIGGVFANADNVGVVKSIENDHEVYKIANGSARYGYSANLGDGSSFQAANRISNSKTSFAIDMGVEYIIKTESVSSVFDEEGVQNEYDWKIGLALLDIGSNHFQYGIQSRQVSSLKENTTGSLLQDKFLAVKNLAGFNDTLATIVNEFRQLTGNFSISNPSRVVVNVDRYVSGNFYINGELSVNLTSGGNNRVVVKESNLITLTPRWETRRFGVYIPVQYTQHGNFWIGGALKAGPLLLGTHNLLNIFSGNQYLSGGAYLAFVIRPSNFIKDPRNRQYECPKY